MKTRPLPIPFVSFVLFVGLSACAPAPDPRVGQLETRVKFLEAQVDPTFKHKIYEALAREGITLKEWFLRAAKHYCARQLGKRKNSP